MHLPPPGKIGGWAHADASKARRQILYGNLLPVGLEIVDLDDEHLVFLPDGNMDILEHEIGFAELKTREPVLLPGCLEAKGAKERQRRFEARSGRHEWDQRVGAGLHLDTQRITGGA